MAKSQMLKDVQKYLETKYLTLPLDKDMLAVIKEGEETPFVLVTCNPKMFQGFVLSFNVSYTKVHESIELVLNLQDFAPVVLEEQFFIDKSGVVLFGEEAELYNNPLFNMKVDSKNVH